MRYGRSLLMMMMLTMIKNLLIATISFNWRSK
jgi:hypothetical protein